MMCDYCTEDADGYVKGLDKNCHVTIHKNYPVSSDKVLVVRWYGKEMRVPINYCPMCGKELGE